MYYIITNRDDPAKSDLRPKLRDDHIAYVKSQTSGAEIVMAGPLRGEGGKMVGSHFVVKSNDPAAVEDFRDNDPLTKAGLFQTSDITAWEWVMGNPDAKPV